MQKQKFYLYTALELTELANQDMHIKEISPNIMYSLYMYISCQWNLLHYASSPVLYHTLPNTYIL